MPEADLIAPPPPKKRILLQSFKKDTQPQETETTGCSQSEYVSSVVNLDTKTQPRTYSRRKK